MLPGAELFSHHAFVDLETTGLDPDSDEVIELGVLFVHQGQPTQRISRLFRPSIPLPLEIERLTGITSADLVAAPSFDTFRAELRHALSGWTVVAHNAAFEQGFLFELLKEIAAPVLDSCELLHYLYPELESYSLDSMIRWSGVGARARHRALQDCEDTFAMLCRALDLCAQEQREEDLAELLACLDPSWSVATPGSSCDRDAHLPTIELLSDLLQRCRGTRSALDGRLDPARAPIQQSANGSATTALTIPLAVDEPGPAEKHIARALVEGGRLGIELDPGPNRSLAYLRPAAMFAKSAHRRVGITVHSAALRERLLAEDLPELNRALGGDLKYSTLRRQNEYLCRRRALAATRVAPGMTLHERAPRAYLRSLLRRSPRGEVDRASYWFKTRFPLLEPLLETIRSEPATTLGERCPHFKSCYYHSAVASVREAHLVVADHALAAAWAPDHPALDDLVVDEAHHLEDSLSAAMTAKVSLSAIARLRSRVLALKGIPGVSQELSQPAVALDASAERLGLAIHRFCNPDHLDSGRLERAVAEADRGADDWRTVQSEIEQLAAVLVKMASLLCSPNPLACEADQHELAGTLAAVYQLLEAVRGAHSSSSAHCLFATAYLPAGDWALSAQPIDVSHQLAQMATGAGALVLASDGLSTEWNRPWVLERLGLSGAQAAQPFTFVPRERHRASANPLIVLVSDAPNPRTDADAFLDWMAARISGVASFSGGRVLGMFSSKLRLAEVAERVRENLEPIGIQVVRETGRRRNRAGSAHRTAAGTVRLGARAWWQGPELPQQGIRCTFIDKLPIEPHSRPMVAAREAAEAAGAAEQRGFARYRLPRALLLLRQAIQRLNCWPSEMAVIVLASPGSRAYRPELLSALDGQRVEVLPWSAARVRIYQELKSVRPDPDPVTSPAA